MAGLEGEDPPIVHRDLKPSNVFIDGAGAARIADMNLSLRLCDESLAVLTGETGTYLYMSPEMMRHEMYTTKTDVWSFGVTLVELCNQQVPYSSLYLTPLQVAIGVADRELRPPVEASDIPISVKQIIDSCLAQDPFQRPSFVTLVAKLKGIIASVAAAEGNAEPAPSLLARMSYGLGMLQGTTTGQTACTSGGSKHGYVGFRSGGPHVDGSRIKPIPAPNGGARNSPCSPRTAHSSSQSALSTSSPRTGPLPPTGRGVNPPGMGIVGNAASRSSGAAHAIAGGAHTAAGKASAMLTGFLQRGRSNPRH